MKRTLRSIELVKEYGGRRVVDAVSLEVESGEIVGLLGPNGAGKTTTFRMIVGLTRPGSGRVLLDQIDITRWQMPRRTRQGVGYLSQEPSIFRGLTVRQNVLAVLETLPIPDYERKRRADDLLERFELAPLSHQSAASLSGGEKRRLEICRCLAIEPRFLLLDEPFSGVDPIAVADIQRLVVSLRNDGIGILITDHSVRETLEVTDRSYIMHDGRILTSGPASELIRDPRVIASYLGENFYMRDSRPASQS
ncbi:LPS export ABC transporter ATP-binding protein [bacterium]|nr:LPS export ABC transporter ATP-binding protein [bacterium]